MIEMCDTIYMTPMNSRNIAHNYKIQYNCM